MSFCNRYVIACHVIYRTNHLKKTRLLTLMTFHSCLIIITETQKDIKMKVNLLSRFFFCFFLLVFCCFCCCFFLISGQALKIIKYTIPISFLFQRIDIIFESDLKHLTRMFSYLMKWWCFHHYNQSIIR